MSGTAQPVTREDQRIMAMDRRKSKKIIAGLASYYREVRPGLRYRNLYQLAVSVVLSAQTTDRQVNMVTPELFRRFPDFIALAGAGVPEVETIIRSTGFYHNKARNIVEMARLVSGSFGGNLPGDRETLMTLPGVGRKSANVIISMGFGKPAIAVDTHVLRLANRLGYAATDRPDDAEEALMKAIPEKDWILTHLLLIRHGRELCRARNPLCGKCPVTPLCLYFGSNSCTP